MPWPQRRVFLIAAMIALLFNARIAIAAPDLVVTIGGSQISDGATKLVSSKTVTLNVSDDNEEAGSVNITVNNKKVTAKSVAEEVYSWQASLSLTVGTNNVTVSAKGLNDSQDTVDFQIMYVTTPVPGLTYEVPSLPAAGKIEAFNKAVTLTYPRGNVLVDSSGRIDDSSVAFTVYESPADRPDANHFLASQVILITTSRPVQLLQPGQLTLSYDASISAAVANQLAIWYSPDNDWDDDDNYILGGRTDARKNTVTAPFQFSGQSGFYAVFLADRLFDDFTSQEEAAWAYTTVMPMWARGLVEPLPINRSDNKFGAAENINRLEFAAMLVKGLGLPLVPIAGAPTFTDVGYSHKPENISASYFGSNYSTINRSYRVFDADHTPAQYVETAARNGLIAGYPDGTFKPADSLTRQEAAVILARAANLKLLNDGWKAREDLKKAFTDADSIEPWAAPSILAAYRARLIAGLPDPNDAKRVIFDPDGKLTRAQAITMVYRLLEKQKKI